MQSLYGRTHTRIELNAFESETLRTNHFEMYLFMCVLVAVIASGESLGVPEQIPDELSNEERYYKCFVYVACDTKEESEMQRVRTCSELLDERSVEVIASWIQNNSTVKFRGLQTYLSFLLVFRRKRYPHVTPEIFPGYKVFPLSSSVTLKLISPSSSYSEEKRYPHVTPEAFPGYKAFPMSNSVISKLICPSSSYAEEKRYHDDTLETFPGYKVFPLFSLVISKLICPSVGIQKKYDTLMIPLKIFQGTKSFHCLDTKSFHCPVQWFPNLFVLPLPIQKKNYTLMIPLKIFPDSKCFHVPHVPEKLFPNLVVLPPPVQKKKTLSFIKPLKIFQDSKSFHVSEQGLANLFVLPPPILKNNDTLILPLKIFQGATCPLSSSVVSSLFVLPPPIQKKAVSVEKIFTILYRRTWNSFRLDAKQESREKPASISNICRNAPRNFMRIWKRKESVGRIQLWGSELETEEFVWPIQRYFYITV
ncbi:hypothetical protein CEXT_468101 [Caerostris extrusa]|uniref:Uncharacterized protein n=1 Tax=Caerostris extrusa TaxID=172846 RepID=A0AAV4SRG3_CAEEX|nr:hypothetical protein CEXT_468101 [Caerostris extrusa]